MKLIELHSKSAPGKYWVDCNTCCAHGLCADVAPANFRDDADEGASCYLVYKQPKNDEEERQCREALLICPVEAIHDSGAE